MMRFLRNQNGQALIEIVVGIAVVGLLVGGVAASIGSSLLSGKKAKQTAAANQLVQEDMEAIKSVSQSNWLYLYCPPSGACPGSKGSSVFYSPIFSGGVWQFNSGTASTTIDGTNYSHYFIVENVNRDSSGAISESGNDDPSTQKVTIYVSWPSGPNFTFSEYLTRSGSLIFSDRNWSAGNINDGPYSQSIGTYSATSGAVIIENNVIKVSN